MDQTMGKSQQSGRNKTRSKSSATVSKRGKMQRTRSFTDALREKYCATDGESQCEFVIDIVIRGKPRNNGPTTAELAHLRNVVLSNSRVSTGGMPESGLTSLCPNVTDLDLSSNLLESWAELLPLLSQLPHLKFLNLSRNHITRHKEELWRWSEPLPKVENVVLNSTGIPLREVLALARLMPALRELHICCNYYRDLGSVELAIKDGALSQLECLHLNENIITSWSEVWKLRHLPNLTQLILSENPLCDVFYDKAGADLEVSLTDLDSPDITCHSDGEDSAFGSPHCRAAAGSECSLQGNPPVEPSTDCVEPSPVCVDPAQTVTVEPVSLTSGSPDCDQSQLISDIISDIITESCQNTSDIIHDIINDIIAEACQKMSVQETQGQSDHTADNHFKVGSSHDNTDTAHRSHDNTDDDKVPQFWLEEDAADDGDTSASCCCAVPPVSESCSPPFSQLHTLCLSRTSVCDTDHLHALNDFPCLRSLRIMGIALFSQLQQEDRRKLYVASLPRIQTLNGSEVTWTEREKAERHYLRHFLDQQCRPPRYTDLEHKHGPVQPLLDIDLGARFQTHATLTFMLCGIEQFTERVSLLQPVGKLRSFVSERLSLPRYRCFRMFHHACGPCHIPADQTVDELFLDSLPLSRFDLMDGDQIHVDFEAAESASVSWKLAKARQIRP